MKRTEGTNPLLSPGHFRLTSNPRVVAVLAGDGIGPEVTEAALAVLDKAAPGLAYVEAPIGGRAIQTHGDPLPPHTLDLCSQADAILLGAVGDPAFSDPDAPVRPEEGLLRLRNHFNLFANLRPVRSWSALLNRVPLRAEIAKDVDMLFVRELTGGIYFGERSEQDQGSQAYDTMSYTVSEVTRVAELAFRTARGRRSKVSSIDKANVLASGRLWRRAVNQVSGRYPDVELEHLLVDATAMHLITRPSEFDVVLTSNLFGDILSDEASVIAGSLGMLPSASVGAGSFGLYEPVHGSAPDLVGRDLANPCGAILSSAMMLRLSFGMSDAADRVEAAVESVLNDGAATADLARPQPHGSDSADTHHEHVGVGRERRDAGLAACLERGDRGGGSAGSVEGVVPAAPLGTRKFTELVVSALD